MSGKTNNPTLANFMALIICSGGALWGVTTPNPLLGVPASFGSVMALKTHQRKYRYEIKALAGEVLGSTVPLLESTAESLREIELNEEAGPITKFGYRLLMKAIGERTEDDFAWFVNMRFGLGASGLVPYGVWLICGEQREGKSMVARHMARQYLEQHEGSGLVILDIENQSHPPGYWYEIPVAEDIPHVLQAFQQIRKYLDEAKGDGNDPGLLVIFDEVKSTLNALNNKQRQFVIDTLQDCHSKGAKRKVFVACIMHTLTGKVLKWDGITDFAPKSNIIMLQRFANDDSNFNNLQDSDQLDDAREKLAVEKVLPLQSTEPRPCLVYGDKQWSVRWIPTLDDVQMIVTEDPPDPYLNIREFIDGVDLPDEVLSLNRLLDLCGVTSSAHKKKDGKYLEQWKTYLDAHNTRINGTDKTGSDLNEPVEPVDEHVAV